MPWSDVSERISPRGGGGSALTRPDEAAFICEHDCPHAVAYRQLVNIRVTCVLTVASLTTSRAAISAFESPRATSESTSRSRGVRSDNETHEASIVKLATGKTVADLVSWAKHHEQGQPPITGAGFGALGGHRQAWFTVGRLQPGSYAVVCFVPGPDGVPHVAMGMAAGFTVS